MRQILTKKKSNSFRADINTVYNEAKYRVRWIDGFNKSVVKEEYVLHGRPAIPPDSSTLQIHTDENGRKWKYNGYYTPDRDNIIQNTDITLEYEELYRLEIKYQYEDGTQVMEPVIAYYFRGETFGYTSPVIDGYLPDKAFVRTGAEGMPSRDLDVIVIYIKIPTPLEV